MKSIVGPSRELRSLSRENQLSNRLNSVDRGTHFETQFSSKFHSEGIPLLVSSKFLRRRGCGQVDLAIIKKTKTVVAECKSGERGPSVGQRKRLLNSCNFLLLLFNRPVDLITVKRFAKSFDSW